MNVLVACEFSGIIRDEFIRRGHNAWSCDLLPSESRFGPHYEGDIFRFIKDTPSAKWDLMIGHPECKYLCNSGCQWMWHPEDAELPESKRRPHPKYPNRQRQQVEALHFFTKMQDVDIPMMCLENPIPQSRLIQVAGKYSQIVHPWQFGDPYKKSTCLWLKGLPRLVPTEIVPMELRQPACHRESPGPNRSKNRSRTYPGIARAMADQWSDPNARTSAVHNQ